MDNQFNLGNMGSYAPMVAPAPYIPNYGLNAPQQGGSPFLPQLTAPTNVGIPQPAGMGAQFNEWLKGTGITGTKEDPGWGGMAMGAASGIASAYMGLQQYGLARDTLNQHKQEYAANYAAQKSTTNAAMEDRQRARVASNAGAYQSVGDYMGQNGIK
jgi:hypothetical protein